MATDNEQLRQFSSALEDHSAEGIEILYSEPSKIMRMTVLLVMAFIMVALVWSFIGRADVIVTAPGVLSPDEDVRRVYSPIGGELVDIFVAEGVPVSSWRFWLASSRYQRASVFYWHPITLPMKPESA